MAKRKTSRSKTSKVFRSKKASAKISRSRSSSRQSRLPSVKHVVVAQPAKKSPLYSVAKWLLGIVGVALSSFVLFFLFFVFIGLLFGDADLSLDGNVAVISIKGTIVGDKSSGFGFDGTTSKDIVKLIKKADKEDDIKAILLEINSPGGTAVASAEIAAAVSQAQKPTIAVIREVGASGAFWVAVAADTVYAHPLSITGSIGVVSSYVEFSGLLEHYNITYQRLVSGKFKDAGSPLKKLTNEERALFQARLDAIHHVFVSEVARHRNLSTQTVAEVSDGFVFFGSEAKELGFVDELGSVDDAITFLEKDLNITAKKVTYKIKPSLFDALAGVTAQPFYAIGQGLGDSLVSVENNYVPKV